MLDKPFRAQDENCVYIFIYIYRRCTRGTPAGDRLQSSNFNAVQQRPSTTAETEVRKLQSYTHWTFEIGGVMLNVRNVPAQSPPGQMNHPPPRTSWQTQVILCLRGIKRFGFIGIQSGTKATVVLGDCFQVKWLSGLLSIEAPRAKEMESHEYQLCLSSQWRGVW